jgi:hypothetical protein
MSDVQMSQQNTTNYLVPAAGQTHAIKFEGTFSAVPYAIDWRQFRIDNFPFQPQGVYIDNTAGADDLTILIKPINYRVICAAGQTLEAQFPAPNGQTCEITGNGDASIIFVDYPVLPSGALVKISGTTSVSIASIPTSDILNVQMAPLAQGAVPYQTINYAVPATYGFIDLFAGVTTANFAPPANTNLKRLHIAGTCNLALAAAGATVLTVTLNGVTIFQRTLILPNPGLTSGPDLFSVPLDFDGIGLNAGAGNLTASLSVGVISGHVMLNAYFTP